MQELNANACGPFVAQGTRLLFFSRDDSEACRVLWPLLEELERQVDVLVGRVDVLRFPEAAAPWAVSACPTCLLFVGGAPRGRVVGAVSAATLKEHLALAGLEVQVPPRGPAQSPLLQRIDEVGRAIRALPPSTSQERLCGRLSRDGALHRFARLQAFSFAQVCAPPLYAVVQEVAVLLGTFSRAVQHQTLRPSRRLGLLSALLSVVTSPDLEQEAEASGGYTLLDDWLVLQLARVSFLEAQVPEERARLEVLGALVVNLLPPMLRPSICSLAASLHGQAEALMLTHQALAECLVDDLLSRPLPSIYVPPLAPVGGHDPGPFARAWQAQAVGLFMPAPGQVSVRLSLGPSVSLSARGLSVEA